MKYKILIAFTLFISLSSHAAEIVPFNGTLKDVDNADQYTVRLINKGIEKTLSILDLEKLPLFKANIETIWEHNGDFVGVKFSHLLANSGIKTFKRLFIRASDGYNIILEGGGDNLEQAILATRINGETFKLSNKGPFFLIWPAHAEKLVKGEADAAKWVWRIIEIKKVR